MTRWYHRARSRQIADWLAVALVAAIPWSTSTAYILMVAWLVFLIPATGPDEWRAVVKHPAAWLPVALVALSFVGMAWAGGTGWPDRLNGVASFAKLLAIPALFVQFRDSPRASRVFMVFLVSCSLLLLLSWTMVVTGMKPITKGSTSYGVPVRDYIVQSQEFILCAVGLVYVVYQRIRQQAWTSAMALSLLAILFLVNLLFVAPSRTGLVTAPVLLLVLVVAHCRWSVSVAIGCAIVAVAAAAFFGSPKIQGRMLGIMTELQDYREHQISTSAGERFNYWTTSVGIIGKAPVIGHGTGSVHASFLQAAKESGSSKPATTNPHNQTLTVALQLGFVGVVVLLAMWLSHLALFRHGGLAGWVGLAVVAQNIIGSLFNNHLFDFTQSWIYMFGVGVAGAMMLSRGRETVRQDAPQAAGST